MNNSVISGAALATARTLTEALFQNIGQGHDMSHIARVENMALRFAEPNTDTGLISLMALLHDADDYKLFPDSAGRQPNARRIMRKAGIPDRIAIQVMRELSKIGYSRRLQGELPVMPESKAVSDADMCDIMGATGLIRLIEYDMANGIPFFNPEEKPEQNLTPASYTATAKRSACRHMFDKILRLPNLMLTDKGKTEAYMRWNVNILFLEALFREQENKEWAAYLDKFLQNGMAT